MHSDPAMLGTSKYIRAERDFYATIDHGVTNALASVLLREGFLTKSDTIWECACGDWEMAGVLERHFAEVVGTDIEPLHPAAMKMDFLNDAPDFICDAIITNPPFGKLVTEFMSRGVQHLRRGQTGLVAMLGRNELDCSGKERTHLFKNCPEFSAKIVLTWRPRWVKGSTGSPRHQYAWYVYEPAAQVKRQGGPRLIYASRAG